MKAAERDKILMEVYHRTKFLTDEIRVNGDDGTEPVVGLQNILEYHQRQLKSLNKDMRNQTEITMSLKTSHDLKKSFGAWLKERPVIGAVAKNPRAIILWLTLLSAITAALFGFRII